MHLEIHITWAHFPCCLSKRSLKRGFLVFYLTTFSDSVIPKYKINEGYILFQNIQNLIEISKMQQKIEKRYLVSEIIACELK